STARACSGVAASPRTTSSKVRRTSRRTASRWTPAPSETRRGRASSVSRPRASFRRGAGSTVSTAVFRPRRAVSTASAAAVVVLPTPPLPTQKRMRRPSSIPSSVIVGSRRQARSGREIGGQARDAARGLRPGEQEGQRNGGGVKRPAKRGDLAERAAPPLELIAGGREIGVRATGGFQVGERCFVAGAEAARRERVHDRWRDGEAERSGELAVKLDRLAHRELLRGRHDTDERSGRIGEERMDLREHLGDGAEARERAEGTWRGEERQRGARRGRGDQHEIGRGAGRERGERGG